VNRFLTAHQLSWLCIYSSPIHVGSRWKKQDRIQIENTDMIQQLNATQKKRITQNTAKQN